MDLRLGTEVSWFKKKIPASVDLRSGSFADLFGPYSESITITEDQPYTLRAGKLVLAKTLERVELPIISNGTSLAARVEGKSSYARCVTVGAFYCTNSTFRF